jgi:hypothetical protein
MLHRCLAVGSWACLIFIVYATLVSAHARPELTQSEPMLVVFVERFAAYGVLGGLFRLAYPSRVCAVWVIVLGSAVILELLQILIPDRDARIIDAVEKMAGGATGLWVARKLLVFADRQG